MPELLEAEYICACPIWATAVRSMRFLLGFWLGFLLLSVARLLSA